MTDFVRKSVGKTAPYLAALLCVFLSGLILENYVALGKFSNDFSVYWRTANSPVEQAYFWSGRFPFPYAPTMLMWITPLKFIAKWPAYFLFDAASVAAFVVVCRRYIPWSAIGLCLISPPFVRGMFTGQVSALLAALMLWSFGTAHRVSAGLCLGIIASIKPQLVAMAPLMLVLNRDWRAFAASAAMFLGIVFLSVAVFGPDRWPEWLASMDHFHHAVSDTTVINVGITPATIAERFGYNPIPFMIAGALAGAVALYLCRDAEPLEKATAVALGSLLASPYALAYDLAPLLPFLALSIMRGRILAVLAIAPTSYAFPLVISCYELLRKYLPRRSIA